MSEAIISRRGGGSSFSGGRLITETIIENTNWVVPNGIKNNEISVRIFHNTRGSNIRMTEIHILYCISLAKTTKNGARMPRT